VTQLLGTRLPYHLAARQTARRRERGVQIAGGAIAVVCFISAGFLVAPVNRIRQERQLVVDPSTIKGLPPGVALLGKLGTFRALVIDWASIRAERLKQEGKTYEALELHKAVCRLAPRFAQVWVYAAWNMAYNISVMQYSPEARWQWVVNGIKILRDEGIPYNPRNASLYKELAWIYWHKVGGYLDDEHLNYKKALAVEMESVLGAPPITFTDQEYFDWFRPMVEAPRDLNEWLRKEPDVAQLVSKLTEIGLTPDDSLLDFVARNLRPEIRVDALLEKPEELDPLRARRLEVVAAGENRVALSKLLAAVRSKVLRERYKFDLDRMFDLMVKQYGPLDWRNGFSHALYWSSIGDELSREHEATDLNEKMNTARLVLFALQELIVKGRLVLWPNFDEPFESYIAMSPDIRLIPYLFDTYMRLGKEHFGDHPKFIEGTPGPNYMTGFVSNLHTWISLLYFEGGEANMAMAENFYAWLRENNPHPDGSTQERYLVPMEEFVLGNTHDQLMTFKASSGLIRSFIARALKLYSIGQVEDAVRSMTRSRILYETWMKDTKVDPNDRRKMQPFRILLRDEMEAYMTSNEVAALFKVTLWNAVQLEPRQAIYDRLRPYLVRLCEAQSPPWSIDKAFPEPPGMEAYRQQEPIYRGEQKEDVEQGTKDKQ